MGGSYDNLWSGGVLGPGASWCLANGKRGRMMRVAIGHALRSKRGGGFSRLPPGCYFIDYCLISGVLFGPFAAGVGE